MFVSSTDVLRVKFFRIFIATKQKVSLWGLGGLFGEQNSSVNIAINTIKTLFLVKNLAVKTVQKYLPFLLMFSILGANAQGRLVLSEIMANPNNGQLPRAEYVEIHNPGGAAVNLQNHSLRVNNTLVELSGSYLSPGQFLLLVAAADAPQFERFGNVMPLPKWPALRNAGATVALIGPQGEVLDAVTYSDRWYGNAGKRAGGWSLERINPNISCDSETNWRVSEALMGGTPNQRNSVWNENHRPELTVDVAGWTENTATLAFNLPLDDLPATIPLENWEILPDDVRISAIARDENQLKLTTDSPLETDIAYTLHIRDLLWCSHRYEAAVSLFQSSSVEHNDLVINEILFNPKKDGVDFVELYNRSDKILNLQNWFLGNRLITSELHLFPPGEYRVLTTDPARVKRDYPQAVPENFIRMPALPPYANERGQVVLKAGETTVDSLYYTAAMHQPFLADRKGISLERQNADAGTHEPGNFSSASTLAGGATPGYENSIREEKTDPKTAPEDRIFLESRTFSPNGDGFEDLLLIRYAFREANPMLSLTVFDDRGRTANRLVRNKSAGRSGLVTWDGRDENGQPCAAGIYILHAETYTENGRSRSFRESFVLVREP